jgi:hypothetical protein
MKIRKIFEQEQSTVYDKKIKNPETDRNIKIKSALQYDKDSQAFKIAKGILDKFNKKEINKPFENPKIVKTVTAALDKLKGFIDDAISKNEKAPDYDLCQVSIPGTNLFCGDNLGIPRKEMPQLKGVPEKGSIADKLPKEPNGEVNSETLFKKALENSGFKLTPKKIDASSLKATQSQLVGPKVVGMLGALKKDPNHPKITAPIFVSKDGYILDGHHRWAAIVGLEFSQGKKVEMNVVEVDVPIEKLVDFTNKFTEKIGIKPKIAAVKEAFRRIILKFLHK